MSASSKPQRSLFGTIGLAAVTVIGYGAYAVGSWVEKWVRVFDVV